MLIADTGLWVALAYPKDKNHKHTTLHSFSYLNRAKALPSSSTCRTRSAPA